MTTLRAGVVALLAASCGNPGPGAPVWGHAILEGITDHGGTTVRIAGTDHTTLTDAYGYFVLSHVPPGTWTVTAGRDGALEREVGRTVIHDGASPSQVFLALSPIGRVEGRVLDPDGAPIQFAAVNVAGRVERATSGDGGSFSIDPAPAGNLTLVATLGDFTAGTATVDVPVGGTANVDIQLGPPQTDPGLYDLNEPPTTAGIEITAEIEQGSPRVVPLVDVSGGVVRRRGLYRLTTTAVDPDGDRVTVHWTADRGTLLSAVSQVQGLDEFTTLWRAGPGTSTLTATAIDPFGATSTTRLVLDAAGDNIRGGGMHGDEVYYGERRGEDYDLYRFDLVTGAEEVVESTPLEQHAVNVTGDWLVWSDTEWVFIGPLVFQIRARNLVSGEERSFGQAFDHDSTFVIQMDLYTPLHTPFVPYSSSDSDVAPMGLGFFDLAGDVASLPPDPGWFGTAAPSATTWRAIVHDGSRTAWTSGGQVWAVDPGGTAINVMPSIGIGTPADLQLSGDIVASLVTGEPVRWARVSDPGTVYDVGHAATSFGLRGERLVWVEQGPSSASVEFMDLSTGTTRTLSTEPYFARRIWFMNDTHVIWGDQGTEGQAFVTLNTELLWVAEF